MKKPSILIAVLIAACGAGQSAPGSTAPGEPSEGCAAGASSSCVEDPEPRVDEAPGELGPLCGSRGLAPCAEGLDCIHAVEARCGETDHPGRCQARPSVCTYDYRPVCGCDGETHSNACAAHASGVSVAREGPCEAR